MSEITRILEENDFSDPQTAGEFLSLMYVELRRLAGAKLAQENPGHTLQPTALVHEAWLRLNREGRNWKNRQHFFSAAAEAMRRILIDRARQKNRIKHGGNHRRILLDDIDVASEERPEIIEFVHEALERLTHHDSLAAELIKLRFFAGIPNKEAAEILGLSERTASRNWAYARVWLADEIQRLKKE